MIDCAIVEVFAYFIDLAAPSGLGKNLLASTSGRCGTDESTKK